MTAVKKKQEEKNLKILRELLTYESNKYCFDCNQRGPTYINMTIGSFVCTNCGGALRKYNHRVKSISMSNFSQSEMDFIKKRGNNTCKRIYYGQCEQYSTPELDTKNGMLDSHLRNKYELKKWYVEPNGELEAEAARINQEFFDRVERPSATNGGAPKSLAKISVNASSSLIIEPPRHKHIAATIAGARDTPLVTAANGTRPVAAAPATNGAWVTPVTKDPSKLAGGSAVKLPMPQSSHSGVSSSTSVPKQMSLFDDDNSFFSATPSSGSAVAASTTAIAPVFPVTQSQKAPQPQQQQPVNFSMAPLQPIAPASSQARQQQQFQQQHGFGGSQDKYAALAELDDLFSHSSTISVPQQHHQQAMAPTQPYWGDQQANPFGSANPFTVPASANSSFQSLGWPAAATASVASSVASKAASASANPFMGQPHQQQYSAMPSASSSHNPFL